MNTTALKVADGSEMNAYTAHPSGAPQKGVIVLQESFGVNDYIRRTTDSLAQKGFLAIAPELFHRTAPGFESDYVDKTGVTENTLALTDENLVLDLAAAHAWLKGEGIAEDKIAAIGFCMGGRVAFLANATLPLAAAVSFYGGRIAPDLVPRAGDLSGPTLFFWGAKDTHILPTERRVTIEAMDKAGKPYVQAHFSEAGHGFACDAREAYHAQSAREAWALTDAFLANHLG